MKKILYCLLLFLGLLLVPKEAEAATLSVVNGVLKIDMGSETSLANVIKGSEYYKNNTYSGPINAEVTSTDSVYVGDISEAHIGIFSNLTIKTKRNIQISSGLAANVITYDGDVTLTGSVETLIINGAEHIQIGDFVYKAPVVRPGDPETGDSSSEVNSIVGHCTNLTINDTIGSGLAPVELLTQGGHGAGASLNLISNCVDTMVLNSYGASRMSITAYAVGAVEAFEHNGSAHEIGSFPLTEQPHKMVELHSSRSNFYDVTCDYRTEPIFTSINSGPNGAINPTNKKSVDIFGKTVYNTKFPNVGKVNATLNPVKEIRFNTIAYNRVLNTAVNSIAYMRADNLKPIAIYGKVQIPSGYVYGGTYLVEPTYEKIEGVSGNTLAKYLVDNGEVNPRYTLTDWKDVVEFYTYWKPDHYNCTWDLNDGTGRKAAVICRYMQNYQKPAGTEYTNPTRRGYKFLGWFISVTSTADAAKLGSKYDFVGDRTLYAHWEHTQYKILFNDGHTTAENPYIDGDYKLLHLEKAFGVLPTPIKTGYKFIGWFDAVEGGKQYTASSVVDDNTPSTLQLYAHYEKLPEISTEEPDKNIQDGISEVKPNEDVAKELEEREAAEAAKRPESISQTIKLDQVKITSLKNVKRKKVILSYAKVDGATSYQIKFSPNRKLTVKKKVCKGTSKTFRKLRKGVKYYVQVRAICEYDDGTTVYGKWSKVKSIRIKR